MPRPARYVQDIIEAMSIKYNNRVYEKKRLGEDVIVLSYGEAYFDIPLFRFDDLPMPALYHYSHSRGIPELREVLAEYYDSRFGVAIDPATEIVVTAGSKIALHMAFMATLEPGDEVLIHEPAWVSYPEQVLLCHGHPVRLPYYTAIAEYGRFITKRTRAIVVNNPNNPTGRLLTASEWQELHHLADRHDLHIISDEAYSDYVLDPADFISAAAFDPAKAHTIVCNTLSKNYGMSGWRIGYVFTNEALLYQILKVNQHLITCPATVLEWYVVRHFHEVLRITAPQIRDVVAKRREVARMLDGFGLRYLPGEGTFYLFVSIQESGLGSEEFCTRLLEERGVSAVPGIGYGESCDQFIRLSVGSESMDRIRSGVEHIAQLIRVGFVCRLPLWAARVEVAGEKGGTGMSVHPSSGRGMSIGDGRSKRTGQGRSLSTDRGSRVSSSGFSAELQESHAAARWARAVVPIIQSPKDPRTIAGWGRWVAASPGALRNWCRTARVQARRSLVFGRMLRAVHRSDCGRHRPENLLDVVDRRTLAALLLSAGFHGEQDFPTNVHEFLERQTLVRDPDALTEVKRELDGILRRSERVQRLADTRP